MTLRVSFITQAAAFLQLCIARVEHETVRAMLLATVCIGQV